ncbi:MULTISPECIES: hypothetical protein [unclassified Pseudomonas]|uniref:hypothetical protein n=1 Tax=unclassified Pseudomonas TaxID=196821 RepID=UPI00211E5742|nr:MULTISPECIES: hypothetical protein [unclassified Pseudomonas]
MIFEDNQPPIEPVMAPRLYITTKFNAEPKLYPAMAISLVNHELSAYTMKSPAVNATQIIAVLKPRPSLNNSFATVVPSERFLRSLSKMVLDLHSCQEPNAAIMKPSFYDRLT